MIKRLFRFNPEYMDEKGKWVSLKPHNLDLKQNTDYNFFIQDVDKNTGQSYSQKISMKLVVNIVKS